VSIQDEALQGRVRSALSHDKRLSGQAIMVRAADGEVHLKGRVDSEEQKQLAVMVVRGVPGVRGLVSDELEVREGRE
jgi:osmotically-inducible protein OsmY